MIVKRRETSEKFEISIASATNRRKFNRDLGWDGISKGQAEFEADEEDFEILNKAGWLSQAVSDFDRTGFGIGGLGRHTEEAAIPTAAAVERVEQMQARTTTCTACGSTDTWDGAMFTTAPWSGKCDDCF